MEPNLAGMCQCRAAVLHADACMHMEQVNKEAGVHAMMRRPVLCHVQIACSDGLENAWLYPTYGACNQANSMSRGIYMRGLAL